MVYCVSKKEAKCFSAEKPFTLRQRVGMVDSLENDRVNLSVWVSSLVFPRRKDVEKLLYGFLF
ncbi:MAG: hypothetical protein IKK06_06275 [Clostridia bacterium]|nr:hypothetical protein [Clostridia bacterium]